MKKNWERHGTISEGNLVEDLTHDVITSTRQASPLGLPFAEDAKAVSLQLMAEPMTDNMQPRRELLHTGITVLPDCDSLEKSDTEVTTAPSQ